MSAPRESRDPVREARDRAGTAAGAPERLDDLLDRLVAEYADRVAAGDAPDRAAWLERAPSAARPGLERCLRMIDAGAAPGVEGLRPLAPGLVLGGHELVRELGRGGMATVWLARDRELRRSVALKVLRPGLAVEPAHLDRFRREALAVASLDHPNVVRVFGVGEDGGHAWIAMELAQGPTLATVLAALPQDRPPTAEALARAAGAPGIAADVRTYEQALARLLAPVADALAAAHDRGLVHRDVKPSNVLLRADGAPVVADFGLAKGGAEPSLSLTGEPIGTPYYMSPEQARLTGRAVDHRTDVWSLGVVLYEALAGRRPFDGETALAVLDAIKTTLPPPLRTLAPHASRDAQAVARRAMARDPDERYPDARALHADLLALAAGLPTRARRDEGGPLRRAWAAARFATSGRAFEYRSPRRLLGLPLVHAFGGPRAPGAPPRVARGWLALGGERAVGAVAMAREAYGLVAVGAVAVGGLAHGALGIGLLAVAGLGLGLVSFSGVALAYLAVGGLAVGYGAIGGYARGVYAVGGSPHGTHVVGGGRQDPEAVAFFEEGLPLLFEWLVGLGG